MKKAFLILVFFLMAFGIHAQSTIIIRRASSSISAGFRLQIYINGNHRLSLTNGAEGRITVPDGEYTIVARLSSLTSNELRFNIRSGSMTFTVTPVSPQQLVIEQQWSGQNTTGNTNVQTGSQDTFGQLENSMERAARQIVGSIPTDSRIAIVYVAADDDNVAEFIANELEFILVNQKLTVIDRSQLDRLRAEHQFQLSGEVDDAHAVSIGKIAGATVIITGAATGDGHLRRLRLRALDTQTAQVISAASERY
ncbi:MAG: hypothetical protein LBC80_00700 [Treponema sp.]|jgi:hypothetical protein|nr:hypothetical protein [Treponema sp.]